MRIPITIADCMTPSPISIEGGAGVREADALMSANGFRHLPVVVDGKPVGILSDRDLSLARGLSGVDLESTRVRDVARTELYCVSPEAPLREVAEEMARRRINGAVVVENKRVVGIFTTTDALRVLGGILSDRKEIS